MNNQLHPSFIRAESYFNILNKFGVAQKELDVVINNLNKPVTQRDPKHIVYLDSTLSKFPFFEEKKNQLDSRSYTMLLQKLKLENFQQYSPVFKNNERVVKIYIILTGGCFVLLPKKQLEEQKGLMRRKSILISADYIPFPNINLENEFGALEFISKLLKPGEIFGDMTYINQQNKSNSTIITSENTYLLSISKADYQHILEKYKDQRTNDHIDFLLKIPIFIKWPRSNIQDLYLKVKVLEFGSGKVIYKEGDHINNFYIIKDGVVEISETVKILPDEYTAEMSKTDSTINIAKAIVKYNEQPYKASIGVPIDVTLTQLGACEWIGDEIATEGIAEYRYKVVSPTCNVFEISVHVFDLYMQNEGTMELIKEIYHNKKKRRNEFLYKQIEKICREKYGKKIEFTKFCKYFSPKNAQQKKFNFPTEQTDNDHLTNLTHLLPKYFSNKIIKISNPCALPEIEVLNSKKKLLIPHGISKTSLPKLKGCSPKEKLMHMLHIPSLKKSIVDLKSEKKFSLIKVGNYATTINNNEESKIEENQEDKSRFRLKSPVSSMNKSIRKSEIKTHKISTCSINLDLISLSQVNNK